MKKHILFALLAVAGCNQGTPEEIQTQDVVAALNQGSGEACNSPATIQVIRNIIYGDLSGGGMSAEQQGDFLASVDTGMEMVTLDGIDETTNKVSCRGTFFATWQGTGGDATITYTVQPSLDQDGGFVVYIDEIRGAQGAFFAARREYDRVNVAPGRQAAEVVRSHERTYSLADQYCRVHRNGTVTQYDHSHGQQLLVAGAALGVSQTDPTYSCIQTIVDRGPRSSSNPEIAASPVPQDAPSAPAKEDRIEVTGPPVITRGPPPPRAADAQ